MKLASGAARKDPTRHLRVEQVVRYFSNTASLKQSDETNEDTVAIEEDDFSEHKLNHRHYDQFAESLPAGTKFPSIAKGLETLSRRCQERLAVSRLPYLEPIGAH